MKLVKSLLLGSAAGLFAVAGAQAADLPVQKAAPVDYVRVCSTYGTGYWFLPGTDICLRISGYMRADYLYVEPGRSDFDATGFRARGRLNFDFRQPTEYGLLRAFVRYEVTRNSGVFLGSGQSVLGSTPFFGAGATPPRSTSRSVTFSSAASRPVASSRSSTSGPTTTSTRRCSACPTSRRRPSPTRRRSARVGRRRRDRRSERAKVAE